MPEERVAGRGFESGAAMGVLILNLLDGLFTLTFLQLAVASEANPIMRGAYQQSPLAFMAAKLALVQAGLWVLCNFYSNQIARLALRSALLVYAAIVVYHLAFLTHLAFESRLF